MNYYASSRNLHAANNHMKQVVDSKQHDVEYQVGDLVFIKLHPYQQQTVFRYPSQKLASWFYGPYQIELTDDSRIHLVFHVSLPKKKVGEPTIVTTDLPLVDDAGAIIMEPETILDTP